MFHLASQLQQLEDIVTIASLRDTALCDRILGSHGAVDPRFVVISGPSGVGKSTLVRATPNHTRERIWRLLPRTTTRKPRLDDNSAEIEVVTEAEFAVLERHDAFLYAEVYGGNSARYALRQTTLASFAREAQRPAIGAVMGTLALTRILPNAVFVYIVPPSLDELRRRLDLAGRPAPDTLLQYAVQEIAAMYNFVTSDGATAFSVSVLCNHRDRIDATSRALALAAQGSHRSLEFTPALLKDVASYH